MHTTVKMLIKGSFSNGVVCWQQLPVVILLSITAAVTMFSPQLQRYIPCPLMDHLYYTILMVVTLLSVELDSNVSSAVTVITTTTSPPYSIDCNSCDSKLYWASQIDRTINRGTPTLNDNEVVSQSS